MLVGDSCRREYDSSPPLHTRRARVLDTLFAKWTSPASLAGPILIPVSFDFLPRLIRLPECRLLLSVNPGDNVFRGRFVGQMHARSRPRKRSFRSPRNKYTAAVCPSFNHYSPIIANSAEQTANLGGSRATTTGVRISPLITIILFEQNTIWNRSF